jgi:rhodanese-related sulfurtransferase
MAAGTISLLTFGDPQLTGDVTFVDIRTPAEFSRGHVPGALSVEYSASGFAGRVALVGATADRLAVIAASRPRGEDACQQLTSGGRNCLGVVLVGPDLRAAGLPSVQQVTEIWAADLYPDPGGETIVLDVREPLEWETGYVPGAVLIPLGELPGRTAELSQHTPITVICEAGLRSATAASILQAAGFSNVAHVPDGTAGYRRTGRTLNYPEGA